MDAWGRPWCPLLRRASSCTLASGGGGSRRSSASLRRGVWRGCRFGPGAVVAVVAVGPLLSTFLGLWLVQRRLTDEQRLLGLGFAGGGVAGFGLGAGHVGRAAGAAVGAGAAWFVSPRVVQADAAQYAGAP